jgi:hypothetical protein
MSTGTVHVRVFQIHYHPDQISHLDPAFIPYDNTGDSSPLLEFNVFRKIAAAGIAQGANLWGAVSWKFGQKTSLTGDALHNLIQANPDYDVYFCNPFPETEAFFHNFWCHGETAHPDFLNLSFDFLQAAGLPTDTLDELCPSWLFAATNSFVATPQFWSEYLQFVGDALARAQENLLPPARAVLFSSLADKKGLHAQATYIPFIIERLFGVFLSIKGSQYRAFKYAASKVGGAPTNVHLATLRSMKDRATATQDRWLAECWLNYSRAYVSSAHGRRWATEIHAAAAPARLLLCNTHAVVHQQTEQKQHD